MAPDRTDDVAVIVRPLREAVVPPLDVESIRARGRHLHRRRRAARAAVAACLPLLLAGLAVVSLGLRSAPEEPVAVTAPSSSTTLPPDPPPDFRLTPAPSELPVLPSDDELEAWAASVPPDDRLPWAADLWATPGAAEVWGGPGTPRGYAIPVFTQDDEVAGVAVPNLGVIPRSTYEAPGFDPEVALIEMIGRAEYDAQRAAAWDSVLAAEREAGGG